MVTRGTGRKMDVSRQSISKWEGAASITAIFLNTKENNYLHGT